ncbi:MAG: threonine synthase [Ardenticatenaceae bacterium]|nr:threonine synthase [Ardenticatenaceae bacterium]HBY98738.1 threonine synthase [Chloroflexota bacterium]
MNNVLGYRCVLCGAEYTPDAFAVAYVCPNHPDDTGILDVRYDYEAIGPQFARDELHDSPWHSMWRYLPLLPIGHPEYIPPLEVGWTPLYHAARLGRVLGLNELYIKDDGRNPTASFKDRASAVAVVKAQELGYNVITTASSGNAAAALAGLAASAGLSTVIFVPASAPEAKVAQLLIYGATVVLVEGSYDQAFDLCLAASKEFDWYCRNTAYNPFMSEGKKTVSFEICEQLGWEAPDKIFVAVGDGCIIGGVHKGLRDLQALGWIDRMPEIIGVQAEGSDVLATAWERGTEQLEPIVARTIADSISVGVPRDAVKALRAVTQTGGRYVRVSDDEILEAMRVLARGSGVFAEPAGAASFAGVQRARREGWIREDQRVVVIVTGNGLKDIKSAMVATGAPYRVAPDLNVLRALLARIGSTDA